MLQESLDLLAEAGELNATLDRLKDEDWERETTFMEWTPWDVIAHLHYFDLVSLAALKGEEAFAPERDSLLKGIAAADPLFAIAIALYILYSAWAIFRGALDQLMDRELPEAERRRIREIALSHADVRQIHDLRTRTSGTRSFIQLHLELDGAMTLYRAHVIADTVEAAINQAFPGAEVIIHQDPAGLEDDLTDLART